MVKLIAIDLDGTLLDKGKYISEKNIEALKFAQKRGIEVVIATGRANFDAQNILKRIRYQSMDYWDKWCHHTRSKR